MSTSNPLFEGTHKYLSLSRVELKELRIRSFRAVNDPLSAKAYAKGHLDVLNNFGLNLSSANEDWQTRDGVFAVLIESCDGQTIYGGARIELYTGLDHLPIETAISEEAPEISRFLKSRKGRRIGEICGLWNSLQVAGLGIGSTYSIRCAIALAGLIGVEELVALCSPYTYRIANEYGFTLLTQVGIQGAIPYAGANEIAHITFQGDVRNLSGAKISEKMIIESLRKEPRQIRNEEGRKGPIEVHYFLSNHECDHTSDGAAKRQDLAQ